MAQEGSKPSRGETASETAVPSRYEVPVLPIGAIPRLWFKSGPAGDPACTGTRRGLTTADWRLQALLTSSTGIPRLSGLDVTLNIFHVSAI